MRSRGNEGEAGAPMCRTVEKTGHRCPTLYSDVGQAGAIAFRHEGILGDPFCAEIDGKAERAALCRAHGAPSRLGQQRTRSRFSKVYRLPMVRRMPTLVDYPRALWVTRSLTSRSSHPCARVSAPKTVPAVHLRTDGDLATANSAETTHVMTDTDVHVAPNVLHLWADPLPGATKPADR